MGAYLSFNRYKKNSEYIISESNLYDLVEADYHKLEPNIIGEGISFRNGIFTVSYLMNNKSKSQWGIYSISDFFFYFMAVSPDEQISFRKDDSKIIVALFKPDKILNIINIILNNIDTLYESEYNEIELENLKKLSFMLSEAVEKEDFILVMWR